MSWYLGLDQSSSHTGVALTDGSVVITTDFRMKEKLELQEKLFLLENFVHSCCTLFSPEKIFTEAVYTPSARLKSFSVLLRVETTIHNYLYRSRREFESISANKVFKDSWPRQLGLDGTKEFVRAWLVQLGSKMPVAITDHELDAVGILFGGLKKNGILKEANLVASIPLVRYTANEYLSRASEHRNTEPDKAYNILHSSELLSGMSN